MLNEKRGWTIINYTRRESFFHLICMISRVCIGRRISEKSEVLKCRLASKFLRDFSCQTFAQEPIDKSVRKAGDPELPVGTICVSILVWWKMRGNILSAFHPVDGSWERDSFQGSLALAESFHCNVVAQGHEVVFSAGVMSISGKSPVSA